MGKLTINQELVSNEVAAALTGLCPFGAMEYENGRLSVNSACRMCRLCVKKGPKGVVEFNEDGETVSVNKDEWKGIAVYADGIGGKLHPVSFELLGKARELSQVTGHEVISLLICGKDEGLSEELLSYGADKVYVYESEIFESFGITTYANAFEDFIKRIKPSAILVGATNTGRSLAPRIAARFKTGLTADCTVLQMKENTDLVQIRPAFGGNIMAQIVTPKTRPQFCTVRYKIFKTPKRCEKPSGTVIRMETDTDWKDKRIDIKKLLVKPASEDISEAEVIVAIGRGVKAKADIPLFEEFAELIGAKLACTRPLVEGGWLDASHQIGLSGKTVNPKLIITFGISGAVQFAAGMKGSECIISVNSDRNASIFDVAHYCIVGDIYEVLDELKKQIREGR